MEQSVQCCLPSFPNPTNKGITSRTAASVPVSLPENDLDLLRKTYQTTTTIDVLLIKAWAIVLRCYTGSDEIAFGYQREQPGQDQNVQSSVVAVSLSDDDQLTDLRRREISITPTGDEQLDFQTYNTVFLRQHEKEDIDTSFDLTSTIHEDCRIRFCIEDVFGLPSLNLDYWRDEMSTGHVTCIAQVLSQVISQLLSHNDRRVGQLEFFTPQDSRRVARWNTAMPPTRDQCIHSIVQRQGRRWPVKEAICAWDGSFTYGELDSLTSRLASYLQSQGVGPETMVPLCFEKTKWYMIALFAVLKAGGAFVPLDPSHPESRLRSLIDKVGAKVVLTSAEQQSKVALATLQPVIAVDDDLLSTCTSLVVEDNVTPSNAAYIIFTSGSTGEPKGTLVEHRAFASSSLAHTPALRLSSDTRTLQFAAHTFDASLVDILSVPMNGGTVCIPSEESRINDLAGAINDLKCNYIGLTPSVIEFLTPVMIPNVETVCLAGEAMSINHRNTWCHLNLVNGFGPTETSITSAGNPKVTRETDVKDIGLPVGGRCWIVDPHDHHRMMPVGAVGEMLVEGPSLARGYLHNPEKTDEAFIYAPSWATDSNEAGEKRRFYKSGDLDTQVKLHGQRVELGEIESRLTADVDIQLALVHVPRAGYAKGKLVTIFCFTGTTHNEARELELGDSAEQRITGLRQRISTVLPTYMVPGIWLNVESLPLLTSGKLDRKKVAKWLEEIEEDPQFNLDGSEELDPSLYTPANETEQLLAEAWSRVLNIPVHRLKLTENFLKLGGDSLTAMTCTNLCKKAGIGLTVQDILRRHSIRDLALHTSTIKSPTFYEDKLEQSFDLSPIQYLHSLVRAEDEGYFNQSIQTRVHQNINQQTLRTAIEALVTRHSMLRSRFSYEGQERKMQQRITKEIQSSYRLNCQSIKSEAEVDEVISNSQRSINCFVGPLLSVDLIDEPGKGQMLSLVGHHLVVDIVSFRLILEDLEELILEPSKAATTPPSMPFQMWTAEQAERAEMDAKASTELDVAPPHNFKYWGVDDSITYGQVQCSTFEVSAESTALLLTGCHESLNTETVDLLLACMLHGFSQAFPDGHTPVINNEGHGREPWDPSIDISRTVGWFTTLYPIWVPGMNPDQDILQTVTQVKDMRRFATDNGRAFFAHRTLSAAGRKNFPHPVPMEMSFNYLGQNRDLQNQKGLFHLADTMVGETREGGGSADYGRDTPRFALFEISAAVIDGQLRFTFSYGKSIKHKAQVQNWMERCQKLLETLPHQLLTAAPTKTVSDFPMLKMTNEQLEMIESGILPRHGITSLHAVEDMYPCTRMQQGILLSRCRNPLLYAVHTTFEVRGMGSASDAASGVLAAWSKLIAHHAMLRTIFVDRLTPRTPFAQVVLKDIGHTHPAQLTCETDEQVMETFASRDVVPYHDSHRFSICTATKTGNVFCRLEMNHAAMDGSSISILLRDLKDVCSQSFTEGSKPDFRNFAKHLDQQTYSEATKFWTSYLDQAQPCHIPLNPMGKDLAKRTSIRTSRIEFKNFSGLHRFCETAGITHSTVFNVAWGLLLSFLTQSNDVCFAYTTSLRDAPVEGVDAMIGPVMNLNVCRIKIPGPDAPGTLLDVLQQTQNDFTESLPHRACSLIDVLHEMKMANTSLFNSGVSYRKLPPQQANAGSDSVEFLQKGYIHDPAETAVYVNVESTDASATIELNHWIECLSEAQADLIAKLYVEKIEDVIRGSEEHQIVSKLRQIGDEEKSMFEDHDTTPWVEAVATAEPCLLPSISDPKAAPEDQGVHSSTLLSVPQPAKLLQFCKENDFEAALVYQFVWAIVLRLYSGSAETCFGVLDTSRPNHRLENRVVNASDTNSIIEVLQQLKIDSANRSKAWISASRAMQPETSESIPFNTVVCANSGEDTSSTTTINRLLSGGNFSAVLLNPGPLTRRSAHVKLHHSKDVAKDYVESITDCFLHVLAQIPSKSLQSIGDLDFVDDKTCRQYHQWSMPMPQTDERCAHEIIQERAGLHPSAPAVSAWDGSLDYSELLALTTKFSQKLRALGVGPGVFVACLFDKSMWAVVAQLAVMQAGGAFVSLDPTHAEERLKTLVGQLKAPVVLCSASRADIASRISEVTIAVELDDFEGIPEPSTLIEAEPQPSDPAYAVFTSGTTGTPKASVIEHTALTVSAAKWRDDLGFGENTRTFQFSAFTFDVSVMDVFFTLLTGGCICMPSETERMNDVAGAINRSGATLMSQVPSLFATINPTAVPTLKYLISGGEKMTPKFMEQWKSRHLVNAYGPSETTVVATVSLKSNGEGEVLNTDGTEIGTTRCGRAWIVDTNNADKLMPRGAVGELVIEGPNVGRGYLNNDEKTKHSFIRDPEWSRDPRLQPVFRQDPIAGGQRMYRSGDLARFSANGSLHFLTRNDTQVKLKGQRVELEEIEHHSSVLAATEVLVDIVTPKQNTMAAGLGAFFVSDLENGEPSDSLLLPMTPARSALVASLREGLPRHLPLYMVPSFYFPVRCLPRTTSAKLDRRGLQTMAASLSKDQMRPYTNSTSTSTNAPKTGLEPQLRALWEGVMRLAPGSVTDEDNFFGLGGDSFAAMTLVSAAQASGLSLTVADIFTHPTLIEMCIACQTKAPEQVKNTNVAIEPFSLIPADAPKEDVLNDASEICNMSVEYIQDIYPCSPVQSGLITSSTAKPGAYVVRSIYQLARNIDLAKFRSAWQRTVDDLPILRTRIVHTADAGFCQVVLRKTPIEWNYRSDVPRDSASVPALPKTEGDVLTDYTIVDTGSERYFVWSLHHSVYDGWSIGLMLQRVQEHYLEMASAIKQHPAPYNLFIEYLAKGDSSASDEFWKNRLADFNTPAFPRVKDASRQIVSGTRQHSNVDLAKASNANITLPVLIRGAWALAIADQSESPDVCFGETLMARNIDLPGVTSMAGPVLTTVPTRVHVDKQTPVLSYLQKINQQMIDVIPHQHAGVQQIRRLTKGTAAACEFQNLLVVQSEDQPLEKSMWESNDIQAGDEFFTHPLVVECKIAGLQIKTTAHHDEQVITGSQVNSLITRFNFILAQLVELPKGSELTVGAIDLVSPSDKQQILEWNGDRIEPIEKTIHDLVYKQSSLQPHAEAICAWDGTLSYREMCDHAADFAHYLISLGLQKEMFVPVCMDKSAWMVVAILGVLAAGGAYVPLDPAHPASRHGEIIADVGAEFVICLPKYSSRYADKVKTVLAIDQTVFDSMKGSSKRPLHRSGSTNMAYALFTSGSTGKPKGIVTEHASFVTSVSAFGPVVHLDRGTRAFHFASLTFDAAVMEIWGTLIFGGCVCIPSEEDRLNDVAGAMNTMGIHWTFCTPSVASIIEPSSVPTLKTLVCGGEMISHEVINKWTPHVEVINGYGPTETSVFATLAKISPSSEPACIGHGIQSTCTWVVDPDDHDRLMPVGSVGELALSGRALAREYLNNPEKTNAEFIENPRWAKSFPTTTADRIYKTGDLVRYYPNGAIECLGRKDHQVKLHGQRMELGEIESRLSQMDSVRHAIVLLPKTGLIKKRLVAILAVNAGDKSLKSTNDCQLVDPSVMHAAKLPEVQASLEKQLPIYMVPQAWVVMQNLPMLVSGKIDRKQITAWIEQLDKPNYERIMKDYDDIKRGKVTTPTAKAPETSVSAIDILRDVCAQVLNLTASDLDVERSFLSLGGDSITGMAVVSKSRKQGLTVRLQDIIQTDSLEELAKRSTLTANAPSKQATAGRARANSGASFSLSPIQNLYFQNAVNGHKGASRFNQSITVRLARKIDGAKVQEALKTIVLRHGMLRARFTKDPDGDWKQRTTRDIESSYAFRIHATSDRDHIKKQMGESQRAPDPEKGPIVVADMFDAPGTDQVLFLVANHLCIDMVSWRVVLQELEEYLHTGTIASEIPLSFQAWCGSQSPGEKDAQTLEIAEGLPNADYWGVGGFENTYGQVKTKGFSLDETTTALLLDGVRSSAATEPLDLLLAVTFQSFSDVFPNLARPTIFNESHGRQSATQDVSETVGWFTAVKALKIKQFANITETIKQVKQLRQKANNITNLAGRRGPMEILFNYLGKLQQLERADSLFQHYGDVFAEGELTDYGDMGSRTARFALFELSAIVIKDKLRIAFTFNKNLKNQEKIAEWMSSFESTLRKALPEFRKMADEITPASYPLLPATSRELSQMVDRTLPRMGIKSMADVENIYPVAPVQEGILLSQLRDPSNYMFHAIFKIDDNRSGSAVDIKLLAAAWQKVVDRHPILRTIFVESNYKNGTFDQVVLRKVDATPSTIACSDVSSAPKTLATINLSDVNKKKSPQIPHHMTICRVISTGEVYVKLEMNHALIDGASISIILRDFSTAYGNPHGRTVPGPAYSHFVKYLRERSDMSGLQYWAQHLRNVQICHIPVAQNLTKTRRLNSLKVAFHRFDELQALCKKESITFASLALATWATVLSALTGQDDVCFGYLSAGRDVPVTDIQDAVGVFINMLCCRVKLSSRQDYGGLFRQVQNDFLEGLPHQATSLAEIQNYLGMDGQMMFNSTLSIQNQMPSDSPQSEALSFSAKEVHDPSEYPMTVNVLTAKDNEGIMLRYWSDKISDSRAHAIAAAISQTFENALQEDKGYSTYASAVPTPIPGTPMLVPDLMSAPSTPQMRATPTPPRSVDMYDAKSLHNIIDERVHAVVNQLLGKGGGQPSMLNPSRAMNPTIMTPPRSEENLPASLTGLAIRTEPPVAVDAPVQSNFSFFEPKLLKIWSTMLEVETKDISHQDSFFRLGGDSIKAMKLASAAREQDMALRVSDIFQSPVFEDMLRHIADNSEQPQTTKTLEVPAAPASQLAVAPATDKTVASLKRPVRPRARSVYETVQLDSEFLQRSICPQIGTFKGAVADVVAVTDFQAFSLTAQQFKSRWMLNYFYFEGHGPLDIRRLREACKRVLDAFDILRSVFVCAEGQFYQVVLKKMKVDLGVHDTEMDLDDFVASLQQRDRDHPPKHGEPFVKFAVVRKNGTNLHRILIRMSHAQYDGVCLWKLLDAVKQGYEGGTLPRTSTFSSHIRLMSSSVTQDHYEHFTTLLKGSTMPEIIRRNGPNTYCHVGSSTNVNKTVGISMGSKGSITVATVVQAAWAMTLAKISAQPDVVFGLTINGRNACVPGIETAVGPCVNVVPVRVAFGDQWNGLDLLRYIQDQSVANMPYENLGFREIIHRCTDWPNWTYFTTSVFHQNVHYEGNITLHDEAYRIGGAGVVDNLSDLTFVSTPLAQEGQYNVSLHYSDKGPIDSQFAARVLEMAIEAIGSLTTNSSATLPSPTTLTSLPAQQIEEPPRPSDGDFLGSTKIDSLLVHSPALTHAWSQVLSKKDSDESSTDEDGYQLHSTFFELGGDLLDLGKVVYILHQDEYDVKLEDLLEHPTFLGQLAVLALCNEDAMDDGNETEGDELTNKRASHISSKGVRRQTRRASRHNRRTSAGVEDNTPPMPGDAENRMLRDQLNKQAPTETPAVPKRSSRRWSRLSFSRRRSSVGNNERPAMPGPEENHMLQEELNKRAHASGNVAAGVDNNGLASKRSSRRFSRFSRRGSIAEPDTALPPMPTPAENRALQDKLHKHALAQRSTMASPSGSEAQSEATRTSDKTAGSRSLWKSMGFSKSKTKLNSQAD
ncbi:hypothetical protein Q7P37_000798 [Cladosporium fusiforme]